MEPNTAFAIVASVAGIRWLFTPEHTSNAIILVASSVAFCVTK